MVFRVINSFILKLIGLVNELFIFLLVDLLYLYYVGFEVWIE